MTTDCWCWSSASRTDVAPAVYRWHAPLSSHRTISSPPAVRKFCDPGAPVPGLHWGKYFARKGRQSFPSPSTGEGQGGGEDGSTVPPSAPSTRGEGQKDLILTPVSCPRGGVRITQAIGLAEDAQFIAVYSRERERGGRRRMGVGVSGLFRLANGSAPFVDGGVSIHCRCGRSCPSRLSRPEGAVDSGCQGAYTSAHRRHSLGHGGDRLDDGRGTNRAGADCLTSAGGHPDSSDGGSIWKGLNCSAKSWSWGRETPP
jgi:hypothetical protein